jgi:hypothetical protein
MSNIARIYTPREVEIEGLGKVLFMVDEAGRSVYVPIRPICVNIKVDSRSQLERIQGDEQYEGAIEILKVPTAGGKQDTLCLRPKETAWWLISIAPRKLPAHLRGRMQDVRAMLLAAADRLVFGDLSDVARDLPLRISTPTRGELTFGCPRCGAALCFVVEGADIHLRIDR